MPQQLSFDLPARVALGREDYFVSPTNALAVMMIDAPQDWPGGKLVLSGPEAAGKTHLVHVWAAQTGACIVNARDLSDAEVPELAQGPVAVEDVPDIATDADAQTALFHLHNLVLAEGHSLLLTGRAAPNLWALPLPDLQSRIDAAQHVTLDHPDDSLLSAVLAKLFNDRQIMPHPDVIPYLVRHMDRSLNAAAHIVTRLDQVSLEERRSLSRALAARILTKTDDVI
ncbi:MAG: chromosomal replication initiator DnaA [Rhodobacteraceae bacterium]|nr:chromosomal replication initiator DnaA [Paracoccaceae bacterium]